MIAAARFPVLLVLALILCVGDAEERPGLEAPQRVVQEISDRFQSILSREAERLERDPARVYVLVEELLVPHVDFSRVSRLVLGAAWRQASETQKRAFSSTFRELLIGTYADLFLAYRRWEIRHIPLRPGRDETDVRVRTEVSFPGTNPVSVVYRMALNENGWMVYEVIVGGVSLVTSYRAGFRRKIREIGIDGLVAELEQLVRRRHLGKGAD